MRAAARLDWTNARAPFIAFRSIRFVRGDASVKRGGEGAGGDVQQ
jgi:hypothetical protein